MKKILCNLILLFVFAFGQAQNATEAKLALRMAIEKFEAEQYDEALDFLGKFEKALGSFDLPSKYLRVMIYNKLYEDNTKKSLDDLEKAVSDFEKTKYKDKEAPEELLMDVYRIKAGLEKRKRALDIQTVLIKKGTFTMGSSEPNPMDNETQHQVILTKDFYMGKYEITFTQYDAFCEATGKTKPYDQGWGRGNRPVIDVSWDDAVAYCAWLSAQTGKKWRLPTEAEWEYTCRANTTTPFNTGANLTSDQANYDGNYPYNGNPKGVTLGKTQPVGSYAPNAWGLYDMHGNVYEWCADWYGDYGGGAVIELASSALGTARALRGGGWFSYAEFCSSAGRKGIGPELTGNGIGFRVVFVP